MSEQAQARSRRRSATKDAPQYRKVDKELMESKVKRGDEFIDMKFDKCDFSRFNLEGALFRQCSFKKANFTGAKLDKVRFEFCDMRDAIFKKASLKRTSMPQANIKRADFTDADLEMAIISSAEVEDTQFQGANMKGVDYTDVQFNEALIKGAKNMPLEYRNPYLYMVNEHLNFFMFMGVVLGLVLFMLLFGLPYLRTMGLL